jgi:hypothetical protein
MKLQTDQEHSNVSKALYKVLSWIHPEAIWASILISLSLFFVNNDVANVLSYVYLYYVIVRRSYFSKLITFPFFLFVGLFAAHRFDTEKVIDWFIQSFLPVLLFSIILIISKFSWISMVNQWIKKGLAKIKLHSFFLFLMIANIISLSYESLMYLGSLIILVLSFMLIEFNRNDWKMQTIAYATVLLYVSLIHLFAWKGILEIGKSPLLFLQLNWSTIIIPFIVLFTYFKQIEKNHRKEVNE